MRIRYKFSICILSGFLLWAIYSFFFNIELWDSKYGYNTVGLIGLVFGLSWPGKSLGYYLGQFLYYAVGLTIDFVFAGSRGDKFFIPLTALSRRTLLAAIDGHEIYLGYNTLLNRISLFIFRLARCRVYPKPCVAKNLNHGKVNTDVSNHPFAGS